MFNQPKAVRSMAFFIALITMGLFSSCSFILDQFTDPTQEVVGLDQDKFGIVFSHNVNGETHPCGCRHFPLGGLPQVAGVLNKISQDQEVIYIDTGDTLFASYNTPKSMKKSTDYNAVELIKALGRAGLKYWVPGDQDFANGLSFIGKEAKEAGVNILLANVKSTVKVDHKKFVMFEKGPHKIFVIGLIDKAVLPMKARNDFRDKNLALKETIEAITKEEGYDPANKFHRLVIASHAGIDHDTELAKNFPMIDWIIGAHTMNFLRFPQDEGQTQIVQVLSRNHYLGHITFDLTGEKTKDKYEIHEIRDEDKDLLKPNPFLAFIDKHKEELSQIQLKEQEGTVNQASLNAPYTTASSCIECHEKQGEFWQGTAHSIAYQTLVDAKEQNNLTCVKCHSLGLDQPKGFHRVSEIVEFDKADEKGQKITMTAKKKAEFLKTYWAEVEKSFAPIKDQSIRKLAPKVRRQYASAWMAIDEKEGVTHNFANVQCLNCHTKHSEHPFEVDQVEVTRQQKLVTMQDKCLNCHDPDQSPEWYTKTEKGTPGDVDYDVLKERMKKVSCPRIDNDAD